MSAPDRDGFIVGMYTNTLAWLKANPHDFDTLASGPLGEALTRDEIRDLADDPESMQRFIAGLHDSVAQHSPKRWYVDGKNITTGESWGVTVAAPDRGAALAKVLRRGTWATWLLEGIEPNEFQFMVRPVEPADGRPRCDYCDPFRCDCAPIEAAR